MERREFERQVVPLYRKMYFVALRLLSDSDMASDAVQECFDKLYRRRDVLDTVDSVEAYCMTSIRHEALTMLRNRKIAVDTAQCSISDADDTDRMADRDSLNYVMGLIEQLPDDQRRVLSLSVFEDCDNNRISEITGFSSGNIRQLLSRARKKLKQMYSKNER